jgi:hypothetical protein
MGWFISSNNMQQKNYYPGRYHHDLPGRLRWDWFKRSPEEIEDAFNVKMMISWQTNLMKWIYYLIDRCNSLQQTGTEHERRIQALGNNMQTSNNKSSTGGLQRYRMVMIIAEMNTST